MMDGWSERGRGRERERRREKERKRKRTGSEGDSARRDT
jgi:hypothetical protein